MKLSGGSKTLVLIRDFNQEEILMAEKVQVTKELIKKAMECKNPEQLVELAKSEGIEITKEEAEAFLAQAEDVELDSIDLQATAGGGNCNNRCWCSDVCGGSCWAR